MQTILQSDNDTKVRPIVEHVQKGEQMPRDLETLVFIFIGAIVEISVDQSPDHVHFISTQWH